MTRYTDIDQLIDKVEKTTWYHINKNGELVVGANSKIDIPLYKHSDIKRVLEESPMADYEEAKQEVAREIFEEIEKIRSKEIHKCETLREQENEVSQRKYWEGGYNSLRQLSYWIAELKKKYTEEKHEKV